ncbi:MAG: T9SS type A sorting domain-containing protein [Bacteroidetes bacterium]|nr:T9SS type A sorting domain-containing protein [Bacteroidota bacterium]MBS1539187.1 T9SS type A sorting domain-containing protein [Bacteroidota bacterium]
MRILFLALLCETFYISVTAQVYTHADATIPVVVNGKKIPMPWAGGLNAAQINTIDLNGDGRPDLAVFDRTANKVFTYLAAGNQYTYTPDYETFFPSGISNWMLLRDINCDGKKDLLTSNLSGISAFINTTQTGKPLSWRPFNRGNPLLTVGLSGTINLQMNASDIPAIDDVDGDGDLDIIVSRFSGEGSFAFHRNMSIENTGRCDSLQLKLMTNVWGNMYECECGSYAFNGRTCPPHGARIQHDEGKSLLTLDLTNDGLHDLLFSEEECNSLYSFPNQGTPDSALFNSFSIFPSTHPSTVLFPAAYFEDVDFDGFKDLMVSTNISNRVATAFDLSNSVWFYKNTGTNSLPQFSFQKSNFLQEQMIDVGSYSSPAFADYDGDGDLDMFISYWATADTVASIYQFQNTGNYFEPSYQLITSDFLNFSSRGLYNIKIQFLDINGDGKTDLVFTATDKTTFTTQLYYMANQSTTGIDLTNSSPVQVGFSVGQYENLYLYDIDSDGNVDILWGKADGSLQYYRNLGSFVFVLNNASYLGVGASTNRYCVSPVVADFQNDGKPDLILGSKGSIVMFRDFKSATASDTLLIHNSLKNEYESKRISAYLSLTAADLHANKYPLIIAGTITGGLVVLKQDSTALSQAENIVTMYPNPVAQGQAISFRGTMDFNAQFFNIMGQKISEPIAVHSNQIETIEQSLSAGMYFVRCQWNGGTKTLKLIVK